MRTRLWSWSNRLQRLLEETGSPLLRNRGTSAPYARTPLRGTGGAGGRSSEPGTRMTTHQPRRAIVAATKEPNGAADKGSLRQSGAAPINAVGRTAWYS